MQISHRSSHGHFHVAMTSNTIDREEDAIGRGDCEAAESTYVELVVGGLSLGNGGHSGGLVGEMINILNATGEMVVTQRENSRCCWERASSEKNLIGSDKARLTQRKVPLVAIRAGRDQSRVTYTLATMSSRLTGCYGLRIVHCCCCRYCFDFYQVLCYVLCLLLL